MKSKPTIRVTAAVIYNSQNNILITMRPPGSQWGGYWEFPGGRIEDGETAQQALQREIKEELALAIVVEQRLYKKMFEYEDKYVDIVFYRCRPTVEAQTPQTLEVADWRWVQASELPAYKFPPADLAFIQFLLTPLKPA